MSADVEPWTCAMHGITTTGDCPRCDDEAIASAEGAEAPGGEGVHPGDKPERTRYLMQIWRDRALTAEAERDALRASIWALGESIHGDEGVEHNEGCEGEPDCLACILATLRAALDGPR